MFVASGCATSPTTGEDTGPGENANALNSAVLTSAQPMIPAGLGAAGMSAAENPDRVGVGTAGMSAPVDTDAEFASGDLACEDLSYSTVGEAFLASYCTGCHGGATPMGGLALDSEDKIIARLAGALRQVESGGMPRGNNLPSSDERATFVTWLECELDSVPAGPGDQGSGIDVGEDVDEGVGEDVDADEDFEDDEGLDDGELEDGEFDEGLEDDEERDDGELDEGFEDDEELDEGLEDDGELDEDLEDAIDEQEDD